jgi:septal ring factor EnvC (AmiA/AmiB activator)
MKLAVCFFSFFIATIAFSAVAAENEKKRELTEVQSKIQKVKTELNSLTAEKSVQYEQLKKLEKQYGELVNSLFEIKQEIKKQEENLKIVRDKVSATQKNIQTQQHALAGLIKSFYVIGSQAGLKVLLNHYDPALSGRMLKYHDYIAKARLQKLLVINEDFNTLQKLQAQKDTENQLLQTTLEQKQQETNEMQSLKNQREKLLAQLNIDYLSKKEQMERLEGDEKKLTALLASLQNTDDNATQESSAPQIVNNHQPEAHLIEQSQQSEPAPEKKQQKPDNESILQYSFYEMQGQLPWPVKGMLSQRFGSRRFETKWDGAVISAREGAEIHAVAPGRVVYADWLRGYGLMVIVDHGKGYMTLYAFNQNLYKTVGERVSAGDTLASVGRSGGRAEPALYFGIRIKGRPVDPEHWCRKPVKE